MFGIGIYSFKLKQQNLHFLWFILKIRDRKTFRFFLIWFE